MNITAIKQTLLDVSIFLVVFLIVTAFVAGGFIFFTNLHIFGGLVFLAVVAVVIGAPLVFRVYQGHTQQQLEPDQYSESMSSYLKRWPKEDR